MDPNDPLSRTLKTWEVTSPSSPHFRTAVWSRIESIQRAAAETWGGYLRAHLALWIVVGLLSTVGAGWIGRSAGEVRTSQARETLVASYVESLDPMAHLHVDRR